MSYGITLNDLERWQAEGREVKVERLQSPEERFAIQTQKSEARRLAGTKARATGEAFEKQVAEYTKLALMDRLAEFKRNQFDMRPTRIDGRLVFVPVSKAPVDFSFVLPSGIAGKFDCKSTQQKTAFTWPEQQFHQVYQMRALAHYTSGKCPAFALVNWRTVDEIRVHWIETIKDRVRRADGVLVDGLDWLAVVEEVQR